MALDMLDMGRKLKTIFEEMEHSCWNPLAPGYVFNNWNYQTLMHKNKI